MYSPISDSGTEAPPFTKPLIDSLVRAGLINEVIECHTGVATNCVKVQDLNRERFELGRDFAIKMGCTHFMGRDTDEFYEEKQLKMMLDKLSVHDMLIAPLYDYVSKPTMRSKGISELYVSVAHNANLPYISVKLPVLLDYARTVPARSPYICKENELVMHHFTGVRFNEVELRRKFEGHSHFIRLGEAGQEDYIKNRVLNPPEGVYQIVPDQFGIQSYWDNEFKTFYERYMK